MNKGITLTQNDLLIIDFLNKTIGKDTFALYIRRMLHVNSQMILNSKSDEFEMYKDWFNDGNYWLNEFAEYLDPYLEKEK